MARNANGRGTPDDADDLRAVLRELSDAVVAARLAAERAARVLEQPARPLHGRNDAARSRAA